MGHLLSHQTWFDMRGVLGAEYGALMEVVRDSLLSAFNYKTQMVPEWFKSEGKRTERNPEEYFGKKIFYKNTATEINLTMA